MRGRNRQSGQVMIIVAVWLVALIGSAALILLAGSVEWQRNQLQQLADQAALDAALKIGVSCDNAKASTVITEADNFLATQRTRTGALNIGAGTCAGGYTGTDTFSGALSETIHYPYRAHQQQVEVILTVSLPISFGSYMGASNTNVTRRAVAQQLSGSTAAVSATTLSCTGGQFNVAGTIAASNAIALSGSCAVYAHARFDATSSTYSDLGNASVYANGQAWVGGGGLCVAGSNAGSSNAVCADGYELSGHNATTCGTSGTSAYLSAGDATINPNPCAGGSGAHPVPPLSTSRPPEPNTDAAAIGTLQGTGGAACTPGGVYPNIVVGGTTVGTGLGPVPIKDASGYYHFKPSCYGYLNIATLSTGISRVQQGPESAPQKHFLTATLPAASTAGTLLVATARSEPTPNKFTAPAGWVAATFVNEATAGRSEIWYYPNNPGGISSVTFTITPANIFASAQMSEWRNVLAASPLDQTGTFTASANQLTATVSTAPNPTSVANELVITADSFGPQIGQTIVPGVGWNNTVNDPPNDFSSEYRLDLPAAVASETVASAPATTWSLSIATFKPAGSALGAVFDPGFYYFNGSGFAGGGGICLNGGTLLGRDVTLEFVNQAGFSTGDCTPGGGASCTGACQFGSTPCSISACPPNAAADSAGGGFTWFAAPCSQAPTGDASCPGSSWCLPAGDRACWNLLIWAPATNTGQVAIKGASAQHWLLGSIYWAGTCTDAVNGSSTIDGTISCGSLSVSAAVGAGTAVGSDYGISTALVEAVLVE
ncbi:MAG TPA: pilus assembly protein TadG-related protein [Mycobacterium sp.]|nr:pilus assembly protein TadG-related protein [Mycobacterium sp.]